MNVSKIPDILQDMNTLNASETSKDTNVSKIPGIPKDINVSQPQGILQNVEVPLSEILFTTRKYKGRSWGWLWEHHPKEFQRKYPEEFHQWRKERCRIVQGRLRLISLGGSVTKLVEQITQAGVWGAYNRLIGINWNNIEKIPIPPIPCIQRIREEARQIDSGTLGRWLQLLLSRLWAQRIGKWKTPFLVRKRSGYVVCAPPTPETKERLESFGLKIETNLFEELLDLKNSTLSQALNLLSAIYIHREVTYGETLHNLELIRVLRLFPLPELLKELDTIVDLLDKNFHNESLSVEPRIDYHRVIGIPDLVIGTTVLEIKSGDPLEARDFTQGLLYVSLLRKKKIQIERLILLNLSVPSLNILNLKNWEHRNLIDNVVTLIPE